MSGTPLKQPIVGITADPRDRRLLDGRDRRRHLRVRRAVLRLDRRHPPEPADRRDIAPTHERQGLLDGRLATAGSSASATRQFSGSMGGSKLNQPMVGMAGAQAPTERRDSRETEDGGGGGNRTRVQGFADLCLNHSATPPERAMTVPRDLGAALQRDRPLQSPSSTAYLGERSSDRPGVGCRRRRARVALAAPPTSAPHGVGADAARSRSARPTKTR